VFATNHAGEARELAARFAAQGEPVVIAAGGDGTVNEVVNGLSGSASVLGVLPAGTMNVFARELGIPCGSLEQAFAVIERGFVREVDLFAANGTPFLQMAGVGFDATVIEETSWQSKKLLGPLAYLLTAVRVLGRNPPRLEVVCADGRRAAGVAVIVGNGALYAGPFRFFRHANNRDSQLEVLVYQKGGWRLALDTLRGLARGGIDQLESVTYFQSGDFTVRADHEVPMEVDGEWIGRFEEVRFAETAHHLRVIAPENTPRNP
jgi:YegS/Rv2252/BmrU family lipid kinase